MSKNKYRKNYPLFFRNCNIIRDNKLITSEFNDYVMKLLKTKNCAELDKVITKYGCI